MSVLEHIICFIFKKSFDLDVEIGFIVQAFLLAHETSFTNWQKQVVIVQKILPFYIVVPPPHPFLLHLIAIYHVYAQIDCIG